SANASDECRKLNIHHLTLNIREINRASPMTTVASPPSLLTVEKIRSAIDALPLQGRIMLRLLLLQYLDVTDEDIRYIVADRPDPRCVAGTKPTNTTMTKESLKVVTDRR